MIFLKRLIFLIAMIFTVNGCFGYKHTAEVTNNQYPVTMTESLYAEDLRELGAESYTIIDDFKITKRTWSLGAGLLFPIGRSHFDFSNELDQIIMENDGNAIINFSVKSNTTLLTKISGTGLFLFGTIGTIGMISNGVNSNWRGAGMGGGMLLASLMLPGWNKITISGQVVQVNDF
ncbi:MAG: hypothetical protein WD267_12650 [Balneolales bacterium]